MSQAFILSGLIKSAKYTDPNNKRKPIDVILSNGMTIRCVKEQLDSIFPQGLKAQTPVLAVCTNKVLTRLNTFTADSLHDLTAIAEDYGKIAEALESNCRASFKIYSQMDAKEREVWLHTIKAVGYGAVSVGSAIGAAALWTTAWPLALVLTGSSIISALGAADSYKQAGTAYQELKGLLHKHARTMDQYMALLNIAGVPAEYLAAPNITPRIWRSAQVLGAVLDHKLDATVDLNIDFSDMSWAYA